MVFHTKITEVKKLREFILEKGRKLMQCKKEPKKYLIGRMRKSSQNFALNYRRQSLRCGEKANKEGKL